MDLKFTTDLSVQMITSKMVKEMMSVRLCMKLKMPVVVSCDGSLYTFAIDPNILSRLVFTYLRYVNRYIQTFAMTTCKSKS